MIIFQTPAGIPEHNSLAVEIGNYLKPRISRDYAVLYDTYCYVSHETLESLGHFKNGDSHEHMQTRLIELGAAPSFVAETLVQLTKQGIMPSTYAPDVCVVKASEYENRFRLPLWIGEIVSKDTRDYDLYFKAYLFERLGVKEYFVFETGHRSGKLIRAYRLRPAAEGSAQHYDEIVFDATSANSEALGVDLPVAWTI